MYHLNYCLASNTADIKESIWCLRTGLGRAISSGKCSSGAACLPCLASILLNWELRLFTSFQLACFKPQHAQGNLSPVLQLLIYQKKLSSSLNITNFFLKINAKPIQVNNGLKPVLLAKLHLLPQACCRDAQAKFPEQETNKQALLTALTFRHREKPLQ